MSVLFPSGLIKIILNYFTKSIFVLFDENESIAYFHVNDRTKIEKYIEEYIDREYPRYCFHEIKYYNSIKFKADQLSEICMEVIMCDNYETNGNLIDRVSRFFYLKEYSVE